MYYYYYYEYQNFAGRLKELRTSRGLTLEALATEVHGSKAAIGNLENQKKKPGLDTLLALADYFDVSLDYLVGRSDDPSRH